MPISGCPATEPEDDKIFLEANESLLAAKSYLLFTVDQNGGHSFYTDMRKLNSLELKGLLSVASEQLAELDYMNRECDNEDDEDED